MLPNSRRVKVTFGVSVAGVLSSLSATPLIQGQASVLGDFVPARPVAMPCAGVNARNVLRIAMGHIKRLTPTSKFLRKHRPDRAVFLVTTKTFI